RAPDLRGPDVRGAPGGRRRLEVHLVVSSPETDASGPPHPDETGAGERLHDQGPGGSPEAAPRQPVQFPRRRGRPLRGPLDEAPHLTRRLLRLREFTDETRRVASPTRCERQTQPVVSRVDGKIVERREDLPPRAFRR